MGYKDLREWLEEVERMGELRVLKGADWNLEIGAIRELVDKRKNGPALLFDEIRGYPKGYRLLVNSMGAMKRLALSMNLASDLAPMDFIEAIKDKLKNLKLIPP